MGVVALGLYWVARAGELEPENPPAPTMVTLQDLSNPGSCSADHVAVLTSSDAYVWSATTQTWFQESGGGIPFLEMAQSGDNFLAANDNDAYVWNAATETWTQQSIGSSFIKIVGDEGGCSTGHFGVLTSTDAYVWSATTQTWFQESGGGIPFLEMARSGDNFVATNNNDAYIWNAATEAWTQQSIGSSFIKVIGDEATP
ncbi:hypothetical protein ABI59_17685 [Acidobacteria bacterium Mor1]|nr:hypothetical protein ABI59_17685 [Acidobacteria bacterium Mor1]